MFSGKSLVTLCALAGLASSASAQTFVYEFDPVSAGGVKGAVQVNYASASSSKADITANLDFTGIDFAALKKADGNCTTEPTQYKWHIHVKWSSTKSSDSYAQCSKAATSNHYDPVYACGPNSEFAETPTCLPKIASYACNPANYTANPAVCEKGDLSGKVGDFKLDGNKKVTSKWTDHNYPLVEENTPQWNIILHAVCDNKATPRVACALGKRTDVKAPSPTPASTKLSSPTPAATKPVSPTPAPTNVRQSC
jgi:hypothetical protein